MSNLLKKINRRIQMTRKTYSEDIQFSKALANYRMFDELCWRLHLIKISSHFHLKKDEWILNYLKDKLNMVLEKFKQDDYVGDSDSTCPIWVCWWSGEEDAPELVKQCIRSIRKNAGKHQVNLISEKNYSDYLDIPDYILSKVNSGAMCIAHFTDYLRVSLIEKYGGLWLDATIFCSSTIPDEYFEKSFFTCKSELVASSRYLSQFRWTGFCLGGWKNHVFFRYLKESFEYYWRTETSAIDYLLMDYLFETAYRNLPAVRYCMDDVMPNNLHRDDLQAAMNATLPASMWNTVLKDDTVLYKLSWRETYLLETEGREPSIFAYYLNMQI